MQKRKFNETVLKQYELQGSCCIYCKTTTPFDEITRDHFEPKSEGNSFTKNKVFSCYKCNQAKASLTIQKFNVLTLKQLCIILRYVVKQDWKISEKQLNTFKYLTARYVTTKKIINNGGKPEMIFT
jgi:hypothetical protein